MSLLLALADDLDGMGVAERWPMPFDVAREVEPRRIQTPALSLIDQALRDARDGKRRRVIISMPPQEGKSERVSRAFPLWMLVHNPDLRIASVSAADNLARRWGRQVRNDLTAHPQFGLRVRQDTHAANEWRLDGHDGGMITTSIGGMITGRPVDVMVIDDPIADMKDADSETMRERVIEWWQTAGSMRLPENGIVVVVMTRWHEMDLAGWLLSEENEDRDAWHLINIPAQADHDPAKGETDILGREPGEYMISARGRTREGWEQRKRQAGSRGWAALCQGRPAPAEGGVIKRSWWRYYSTARAVEKADGTMHAVGATQVIQSWDMAFKDTDGSDYVVCTVWGRRGPKAWLLDVVRDRMDFPATLERFRQVTARWPQASLKLVEDKANGPAAIAALSKEIGGILAYSPKDSKLARAYSVSPFIEAGDVELPTAALMPAVGAFVDECASFPNGAHDDQVDSMTQALIRLLLLGGGGVEFMAELESERRTVAPAPELGDETLPHMPEDPPGVTYWST